MAALLGIDVDRTISLDLRYRRGARRRRRVMVTLYYGVIDFFIGFLAGIKAFTAAVLGGIGSLPGAMLGGLLIGLIEAFWSGYFSTEYKDVAVFAVLVLVLIFRPDRSARPSRGREGVMAAAGAAFSRIGRARTRRSPGWSLSRWRLPLAGIRDHRSRNPRHRASSAALRLGRDRRGGGVSAAPRLPALQAAPLAGRDRTSAPRAASAASEAPDHQLSCFGALLGVFAVALPFLPFSSRYLVDLATTCSSTSCWAGA